MRPIKLVMTAFGPYKKEETIDFRKLNENRLFVVSGKTGAGKTTIFDAICFAFYGVASGEDRSEAKMLRSQFADDDTHTSVYIEFELKGKTYSVLRQLGHVKEGNKSATGEKFEFYELTGDEVIPMCETFKVTSVNQKIEETIGLTKDQFSQIVMLPQGEFRKLLTSKTVEKEEILRRIFKTTVYKSIVEKMNERRRSMQSEYEAQIKERDVHINNAKASLPPREGSLLAEIFQQDQFNSHQVLEALKQEIEFYKNEKKKQQSLLDIEVDKLKVVTESLHQGETTNGRFQLLEEKRNEKIKLDDMKPEIAEYEKKLTLAEEANRIEPYEQHLNEAESILKEKSSNFQDKKEEAEQAKQNLQSNLNEYKKEEAKKEEREQINKQIDHLQQWIPVVEGYENKKLEVANLATESESKNKALQVIANGLEAKVKEKEKRKLFIKNLEDKLKGFNEKQEALLNMRDQGKVLKKYMSLEMQQQKLEADKKELSENFERSNNVYKDLEIRWVEGQASILAKHLHDGKECPVCGSVDHPKKAIEAFDIPSKEMLERKSSDRDELQNQLSKVNANLDAVFTQIYECKEEAKALNFQIENATVQYDVLVDEGRKLKEKVQELTNDQKELSKQKDLLHELEVEIDKRHLEKEELIKITNELKSKHTIEKSLLKQSIANIPEQLRSLSEINKKLNELHVNKDRLEKSWENAQKALEKAREIKTTAETNLNNAVTSLKEAEEKLERSKKTFNDALDKSGFKEREEYKQAIISEENRIKLKEKVSTYVTDYATVKKQINELEEELKEKNLVNIAELKTEVNNQTEKVEQKRTELQKVSNFLDRAIEADNRIKETSENAMKTEKEYQLVLDLYDVIRGNNDKRISFERYLQIEFLDHIIQIANERLKGLSNGQFSLVRSDRIEKNNVQSGLGLDVYDNYTGQIRDVKTLSGGEKFNASLCLALGMADVIQAYEGGISIETMFIDEGFGSLDEESLTKAIDTLIDLQQTGRMIGVISHVQELKQAIPAILEVNKTKEGYSSTSIHIR
ncbi:hypothetical protein CIB95_12875 [Lottiidibacillus patelloidae]|uniref:Nuclease SbcCD subunit C n=1 Tax=Lottiidibacillus patelloidae TaxID=2670334 RepID=A0A263BRV4_9BACI|nr:AAA family ATPase [Lottiidibacillus patelloidae]OZM56302.1 hypothetical protein CIB95_12875 [Lottiidibacillus patelloidae]